MNKPLDRLKYHVTGAIERGEKQPITAMTAHNPGPWTKIGKTVIDANKRLIHRPVFVTGLTHAEQFAQDDADEMNARLIASAPEMLDLLKDCLRWIKQTEYADGSIMPEKIEALIAKTEGRE